MANTPLNGIEDTTVQIKIKLDGSDISDAYGIQSINVNHAINKISTAELVITGKAEIDSENISISDNDDFNPGNKIEIFAGYVGAESSSIFKGIIVKQTLKLDTETHYSFIIKCKHEAVKMTYNKTDRFFENLTDDAIIKNVIGNYNISSNVAPCSETNECSFQKMTTDWDFILSRCNFNGFIITLDGDPEMVIDKPNVSASAVLTIEAGVSIMAFEGTIDAEFQPSNVNAIKGTVQYFGNALAKTGSIIEIKGVGKKLSGNAFVSGVTHTIDSGNWITTASFGLDNALMHYRPDFSYTPAMDQLPAIQGLQLATVVQIDQDPNNLHRIKLNIPSASDTPNRTWARMANFYASGNAGSFFLPEIGDEVVFAFLDNDPRYPVILGSLYNGNNATPYTADANNNIKAFVTRSKMKIEFDEEKKNISILTPGNNSIVISDDGKSIEMKDQHSNSIKLCAEGIVLDSAKNIKIAAKGNITMDSVANTTITSTSDLSLRGLNVNALADTGFTAKGNAHAELSASAQTTIKGAIVMIN